MNKFVHIEIFRREANKETKKKKKKKKRSPNDQTDYSIRTFIHFSCQR